MRGFSLFGAVIVIAVAGALSMAVPVFVASNQSMRVNQIQSNQAYYSARGALEFARRQIGVDGNPSTLPARSFKGSAWSLTRSGGIVQIVATSGSASNTFSMADPNPPQGSCLVVDVSSANLNSNTHKLTGVSLSRTASCNTGNVTLTIVSMTVSWTSDSSYKLKTIKISGSNRYDSSSGLGTGSLFPFSSNLVISDSSSYGINNLTWDGITSASQVTMVFNMSDGTSKTAVAN